MPGGVGFGIKSVNLDKVKPLTDRGGDIISISGIGEDLRPTVGKDEIIFAQNESIRDDADLGDSRTPELYSYGATKEVERFGQDLPPKQGTPSIFNLYALFTHPNCDNRNDFYDADPVNGNKAFPKHTIQHNASQDGEGTGTGGRYLTYESLLKDFDPKLEPTKPYFASDFLYNKYYRKIPLNRLITLRRYAFPTYDNLEFHEEAGEVKPIAQATTFFGDPTENALEDLTKMTGFINWEQLTADVHDVEGNERSINDSPFIGGSRVLRNTAKYVNQLASPNSNDISGDRARAVEASKYNTFEYTNEVLGPVNVVNKTHVRQRGLGAEAEYALTFEYQLKSYNSMNPRLVMVDLICNMLALSFNNAKFWGGANRYFPNYQQFGFFGDSQAFYSGDYGGYISSVVERMGDGLGKGLDIIGNIIGGLLKGDLSALTGALKSTGSVLLDLQRHKSRPQVLGFHALLTGMPVGEWHMTIGNPYRPIISSGNLICTGFEFNLGGHLSVDDFPSELKYVINLKNGRPKDKGDVESVFSLGKGRVYSPPKGFIDVGNLTSATGTKQIDNANGTKTTLVEQKNNYNTQTRGEAPPEVAQRLMGTVF